MPYEKLTDQQVCASLFFTSFPMLLAFPLPKHNRPPSGLIDP